MPARSSAVAADRAALEALAGLFGERTSGLVGAVTNGAWDPGRDKHEQYREHVAESLDGSPWARVIKVSDIDAVGLFHITQPSLPRCAGKYRPLLPALRDLVLRADTPLEGDVKRMIAREFDKAGDRLAAICDGPDVGTQPMRAEVAAADYLASGATGDPIAPPGA